MRLETIYTILATCRKESGNYQESFKKEIIGATVLTDYNNKVNQTNEEMNRVE